MNKLRNTSDMESYEEKYKQAIEAAKRELHYCGSLDCDAARQIFRLFPELKESEDEGIRKFLIDFIKVCGWSEKQFPPREECIAWLENQGDTNKWKPSEDEMGALYGLAYLTNKMDDKKDEAITKLYQDLKREFFNGASYENMFPSSPVDAPIKDEKQGEQKPEENNGNIGGISPNWSEEDEKLYNSALWHIKNSCGNGGKDSGEYEVYNWLKSIKDRVQPKPKQEWGEEDEHCIELLLPIIDSSSLIPKNKKKCKEFLKSLKPNHWKPSEEQLRAIINSAQGLY